MTETRRDLWGAPGTGPAGPPSTAPRPPGTGGATAPTSPRRRRRWLGALLVLVALGALLLGLTRCSALRGTPSAVPAAPAPAAPAGTGPGSWAAAPAGPGSFDAGTTSLFDAARAGGRGLGALAGQTAIGHAVPVQSVDADEGFWVGPSADDRVWVQLTSDDESAVTIVPGQLLDLTGPVVNHGPDYATKAGVTAAEGAAQLTREGAHVEVDPEAITIVGVR